MSELHKYGLVRFSKKTGKIDTTMTALGQGLLQLWAIQYTPKTKATAIVDIDERRTVTEYVGSADGFPETHDTAETFVYTIPDELYAVFEEEADEQAASA